MSFVNTQDYFGYSQIMTTLMIKEYIYIFLAQQPPVGHGLLIHEVSRSHTTTHRIRQDSSGRVMSSSQRPLTTHKTHNRQTDMPPVAFEPTISAGERPQTYALDRAATGTGIEEHYSNKIYLYNFSAQCTLHVITNTFFSTTQCIFVAFLRLTTIYLSLKSETRKFIYVQSQKL